MRFYIKSVYGKFNEGKLLNFYVKLPKMFIYEILESFKFKKTDNWKLNSM